jgi:membrane protein DedA with SNARE-associated domain
MEELIGQWGYLAIVVGTFFEGETILVLGGFAAHQGVLRLDLVMASAFVGSMVGDQVWFWVGRRFGRRWLDRHPGKAVALERVGRLLDRWGAWFVLTFRFLYGLRSISPVAIGLSSISALRFTILNMISAAIWAVTVGALGFVFGKALESALGRLQAWEHRILAALGLAAVLYGLHRLVRTILRRRVPPVP